ncbi:MAG: metalloregulator ArsR/SmtB family transcription factor [Candidatus Taylorbacteria bacterium]
MDKENFKKSERILKAVANRRRLAMLAYLKKEKEGSVGKIAYSIKLSIRATSKHLGVLSAVDLVDKEQRSTEVWYRLQSPQNKVIECLLSTL